MAKRWGRERKRPHQTLSLIATQSTPGNGWLPRQTDLDELSDEDIQDVAMTINLTPRKCLGFRSPTEAFLNELGKTLIIPFNTNVTPRVCFHPAGIDAVIL